jgi:hypothetical protein
MALNFSNQKPTDQLGVACDFRAKRCRLADCGARRFGASAMGNGEAMMAIRIRSSMWPYG